MMLLKGYTTVKAQLRSLSAYIWKDFKDKIKVKDILKRIEHYEQRLKSCAKYGMRET